MRKFEHIGNKRRKEHGFAIAINKGILKYCKKCKITKEEFAIKIGLSSEASLNNKLKRCREDTDLTINEIFHMTELFEEKNLNYYEHIKYIAEMYGYIMTSIEPDENISPEQLNQITDEAQMESNEFFATTKKANSDKQITSEEKENMIKDGMEALEKIKEQIEAIRKIKPCDLEEDEDE